MSNDRPQLRWNDSSHRQSTGGPSSLEGFRRQDQQSIDAHQYARQQQIAGYIKQQQIAAWSRWLNDPNAQGINALNFKREFGRGFQTVGDFYSYASTYGYLKECNQERLQHAQQRIFEGSRSFDGTDLIDPDELGVAINGVDRFKRVVGSAPEGIKRFFLSGETGQGLQAIFLGTKPVFFDMIEDMETDIRQHERDTTHEELSDDAYRTHLLTVVHPIYQRIENCMQQDTSGDIKFINRRQDDIDEDYVVVDAVYSNSSVKKLFDAHRDVFPLDTSDNSIRSVIDEHVPVVQDELEYGLLCGYPRYAVENHVRNYQGAPSESIQLLGRFYGNTRQDPRNYTDKIKDQALYHISGMGDFINTSTRFTASSQSAPGTSQHHRLG